MKRLLISAILALSITGCANPISQIKTSINSYNYYASRFEEKCPSYDSAACPDVKDQAAVLQSWNKAIKEAQKATEVGGKYPLQLKALKDIEKKAK